MAKKFYALASPTNLIFEAVEEGAAEVVCGCLDWALSQGHPATGQRSLIEYFNGAFETPLLIASRCGRVGCVRLLILRGAVIDTSPPSRVSNGLGRWTPLYHACANGHVDVARLLIESGADVGIVVPVDFFGTTPLSVPLYAAVCCAADTAVSKDHAESWTRDHVGGVEGGAACVQLLLDRGISIDAGMKDGRPPLFIACVLNNVAAARTCLALGADVGHADAHGLMAIDVVRREPVVRLAQRVTASFPEATSATSLQPWQKLVWNILEGMWGEPISRPELNTLFDRYLDASVKVLFALTLGRKSPALARPEDALSRVRRELAALKTSEARREIFGNAHLAQYLGTFLVGEPGEKAPPPWY